MRDSLPACRNSSALILLGFSPSARCAIKVSRASRMVHPTSTGSSSPHGGRARRCGDRRPPRPIWYGRPAPPAEAFDFRVQPRSRNSNPASTTEHVPNPSDGPFPIGVLPIRRPPHRLRRMACVHQNRHPHRTRGESVRLSCNAVTRPFVISQRRARQAKIQSAAPIMASNSAGDRLELPPHPDCGRAYRLRGPGLFPVPVRREFSGKPQKVCAELGRKSR
jgi:hypothetical protein